MKKIFQIWKGGGEMLHRTLANGFFIFGIYCVFMAMIGWALSDIWLASTQWILVAIVFILVAIFTKMNTEDDEQILQERAKTTKQTSKKNSGKKKKNKHVSFRLTDE